jgi:hypothetical protein
MLRSPSSTHDDLMMQALVWLAMVWCRVILCGTVRHNAVWFGTSHMNLRRPHIFKNQIKKKKTSSYIRVNRVIISDMTEVSKLSAFSKTAFHRKLDKKA